MKPLPQLKHCARNTEGTAAVEFALVAPLLFLLIFGIIESGRFYFIRGNIQHAVGEGSRLAMINTTASQSAITQRIAEYLVAVDPSDVTVSVQTQTINGKTYKNISADYNFTTVAGGLLNWGTIPVNLQVTVPVITMAE